MMPNKAASVLLSLGLTFGFAGCALKGSQGEERYEGHSTCSDPHFTCGESSGGRGLSQGLEPSSDAESGNQFPTTSGTNNYKPVCRLKNDKCACACEPVN